MEDKTVHTYEIMGNRFEATEDFDAYNTSYREKVREIYEVRDRCDATGEKMTQDFFRLSAQARERFAATVDKMDTSVDIVSVGIPELQRYQSEVLPRIGKRMIFKYTKNELITVEEVAEHIPLDLEYHFADFFQAVQKQEDDKTRRLIQRQYNAIQPGRAPVSGVVGSGMDAVAGLLAVNAAETVLRSISTAALDALAKKLAAGEIKETVARGRMAMYEAFKAMADLVGWYGLWSLEEEAKAEIAALEQEPFKVLTEEEEKARKAKTENYKRAYEQGDITPERYAAHLVSLIRDTPYQPEIYCTLYQLAQKGGDQKSQDTILDLAKYLGLDGPVTKELSAQGLLRQEPPRKEAPPTPTPASTPAAAQAPMPAQAPAPAPAEEQPPAPPAGRPLTRDPGAAAAKAADNPRVAAMQGKAAQLSRLIYCTWSPPDDTGATKLPQRTAGLRPDGTVLLTGEQESIYYHEIMDWRDAVSFCTMLHHIAIGLRADGTVVTGGMKKDHPFAQTLYSWRNIRAISAGGLHVLGLRSDGTVVAAAIDPSTVRDGRCEVSGWRDIVAISAGDRHSVGVRADGTVVAAGDNRNGQCNVSAWSNISAVSARNYTVGLTKDGKVIITNANDPEGLFLDERSGDVVAVSAGTDHVLVLHADGTVNGYGSNAAGQCEVREWRNVVAVSAGNNFSAGVKTDCTVVTAGRNDAGECNVPGWVVGPYTPEQAQARRQADAQKAAWKAAGRCPYCGGAVNRLFKTCKSCGRRII